MEDFNKFMKSNIKIYILSYYIYYDLCNISSKLNEISFFKNYQSNWIFCTCFKLIKFYS